MLPCSLKSCSRNLLVCSRSPLLATCTCRAQSSETAAVRMDASVQYDFGPYKIRGSEVFASTELSHAFVNLKPVVPGHVLVSPKRVVKRFAELSQAEVADLWCLAQKVGAVLEAHYKASSLTLAIQDGPAAGQTVPHVHVHVLPRKAGDFKKNDQVYDAIDQNAKSMINAARSSSDAGHMDLDENRRVRTLEEMAEEAAELRRLFA